MQYIRLSLILMMLSSMYFVCFGSKAKTTSTPPTGERSITPLTWDSGTDTLSWYYYNNGDYDQNGEVNIADITPIAMRFKEVGPFDPNSYQGITDGDENGEINGADVVQIARNFFATCNYYNIYSGPTQSGPFNLEGSVFFDGGIPNPDRNQFFFVVGSPSPGDWYYVVPTDGTEEGIPSNKVGG